jgi:hypothetical protein
MIPQPLRNNTIQGVLLGGQVRGSGGTVQNGKGFTVTKGTTGVYTINFNTKYPSFIAGVASIESATDLHARITGSTTNTITWTVSNNSGTATDLGATDDLHFLALIGEYKVT